MDRFTAAISELSAKIATPAFVEAVKQKHGELTAPALFRELMAAVASSEELPKLIAEYEPQKEALFEEYKRCTIEAGIALGDLVDGLAEVGTTIEEVKQINSSMNCAFANEWIEWAESYLAVRH